MTNKVKFKLKITGFELEVEGTKESASLITSQVGETFRGLISPPSLYGETDSLKNLHTDDAEVSEITSVSPKKRNSKKNRQLNQGAAVQGTVVDFTPNPSKYLTPTSKWVTADKAIWLLYVLKEIKNVESLSTPDIVETYNKYFKETRTITATNVTRDLSKKKAAPYLYVGENVKSDPRRWYLLENGIKYAQKLIVDQKGQSNGFG